MKRKWIYLLCGLVFLAGIAAAAYSYTGPKRTVTSTYTTDERRICYWEASHPDQADGTRCYLKLYQAPSSTCPSSVSQGYFDALSCEPAWHGLYCPPGGWRTCTIGWFRTWTESCTSGQSGCTSVQHTTTTTYPPATVTGLAVCDQAGNEGWCLEGARLELIAQEPLSGYVITGIESDLGILCDTSGISVSCIWDFPEGHHSLAFWALSSFGDTSLQAFATMQLDANAPELTLLPSGGTPGKDGWYISGPILISANIFDETSGVAGSWGQLDEGDWQVGTDLLVLEDGMHTITFRAEDVAGNVNSRSLVVNLDSTPAQVDISLEGQLGLENWYVVQPYLEVSASDVTSGVDIVEIQSDGGAWQAMDTLQVEDGIHTVSVRVTDKAGNLSEESTTLQVDTQAPQSAFSEPLEGSTVTASGLFSMAGSSVDTISGLAQAEISLDVGISWQPLVLDSDGGWSTSWDTTTVPNGSYTLLVRGIDQAGNQEHGPDITVVVSNPPPLVAMPEIWSVSESVPVSLLSQGIPLDGARLVVSDPAGVFPASIQEFSVDELPVQVSWNGRFGDGTLAAPGQYPVSLELWDIFGNTGSRSGTIAIPLPPISPTPTVSATATPTFSLSPTFTPTPSVTSSPTRTVSPSPTITATLLSAIPQVMPNPPHVQTHPPSEHQRVLLWPILGLVCLFAALASASLSDRRPRAINQLAHTLDRIMGTPDSNPYKERK